ncbi:ubiquitin-like small modifier protein 1 [Halorientalis salina]|uniref:ubiquitin-like small modifier protein 1 n=1 Tax=Halorientalis salina TaxID=2932266 RepID=UPI00145F9BEB|nr:ubiquitin-like small modifier protein 1 [Halorientalis salina]
MQITFVCYATVRDAVGQKRLERTLSEGTTVGQAVQSLGEEVDALGPLLFDSDGQLRENVNVLVDEENVRQLDGSETTLSDGDTVGIAPGVAGGCSVGVTGRHVTGELA